MTDWPAFAGFAGVVLAVLLLLARLSQAAIDDTRTRDAVDPDDRPDSTAGTERPGDRPDSTTGAERPGDPVAADGDPAGVGPHPSERAVGGTPTTGALLANVALSQGVLATLLLAGAWYTRVPAAALGVDSAALTAGAVAAGVGAGLALYAASEAGAVVGRRLGLGGGEELRRALAPSSPAGWAALLLVVLPVIAGFEELLFRGVLVGALGAGFGVSPWLLAAGSSVAFAAGHGAQGRVGVLVTGALGFVLAAVFVVTGSLLTVVVAHYLVNALEFLVHEWAGVDPGAD